jgi:hypothetical protein
MNKFYPKALRALFAALFLSFCTTITLAMPRGGRTGGTLFFTQPVVGLIGFDTTVTTGGYSIFLNSAATGQTAYNVWSGGVPSGLDFTGHGGTGEPLSGINVTASNGYGGGNGNRYIRAQRGSAGVGMASFGFASNDGSAFDMNSIAIFVTTVNTATPPVTVADNVTITIQGYRSGSPSGTTVTYTTTGNTNVSPTLPNWVLTSTPTFTNVDSVLVTAVDNSGGYVTTIALDAIDLVTPPVTVHNPALSNAQAGVAYSENFTASNGTAPYTFAKSSGTLPPGMTLSSTGTLSGTPTAVGTYTFAVTATDATSTTSSPSSATLTVTPPSLSLSPTTLSDGTYGSTYTTVTFTASGGTAPYTYTALGLPPGITINATNGQLSGKPTAAGTYSVSVTATDNTTGTGSPYSVTNFITWVIDKVPLTVTVNAASKAYGAALPTFTATYSGFANGDNASSFTTGPTFTTPATSTSAVGTYSITASGIVDPNYAISYVGNTLTVTAVALIITPGDASMTYGGTVPSLTATYTGFVNGDNASSLTTPPTITTTATSTSVPGTYPISATGAVDPNYTISYGTGTMTVGKAVLTVTGTSPSMTYGGPVPTLGVMYSGFVGSDNASSLTTQPTSTTVATSTTAVGTYSVTPGGGVATNYTFNYLPGTLTINPATVTVTPDDQTMTYGGAVPALTASYSGFVNGQNVSVLTTAPTIGTTATSASPVGTYPITASGAAATNYTFTYNTGTMTVGPAALTITPDNANMAYGGTVPSFTASYSGFVNSDNASSLTTAATMSTTATSTSVPGTYPITASGAVDPNYTISYGTGTLTVGKATLTVTADNASMTYGGSVPSLSVSYSGFVGSDNTSSLSTLPTISTTATSTSPVGTYPITASGAAAANYTFSYVPGTMTVGQATITVTPDDQTMTYGGAVPALTVSYSGFVNSDGPSVVTTAPTIGTTATSASSVGTYPITASGAAATNYTFTYNTGTMTVGPAALTITPDNANMTYGGTVPAFTASYSGFVNGDNASSLTTAPVISTTATSTSVPGTYPISASGAVDPNYTISYGTGTLTVGKALLTITADNTSMAYGAAVPALSVSYSGFVGSDNASGLTAQPTVTTTATSTSPVGNYPVTASGAASANYTFAYVPGTLTVTRALVTVTPDNQAKTYGAAIPTLTVSYSGFQNGDNASVLTVSPIVTTTATATSPTGTYPINASGAVAANYVFTYNTGALTVSPAVLNITADNATMVYGGAFPTFSVTYSGFVNGDNASSLTTQPYESVPATPFSPVGTYPITPGGAVDPNYTFVYNPGTLTITPAPLTITADNATMVYGSAVPTLTASYSGFRNGDNASNLTTAPVIATTATSASPVGTYPITPSGAVDPNYTITYVSGTMTVTKAALTVTADDKTMPLGGPLPALTVSYSGFVNGDNASSLTTQPVINTTATAGSPAGNYPITPSGAVDPNYTFTYVDGTLTVQKAILTITANNATSVYGSPLVPNGSLTVTYSGFINGDNSSSLTVPPTVINTAFTGAPAGTYALIPSGAVDPNYTIVYVDGTYTITPASLNIQANNESMTYGGTVPALTATYTGFVNGDGPGSLSPAPTLNTTATSTSPVGTYPITVSGAFDPNYTITYTSGTMTVQPAGLTITAGSTSMTYGSTVPALTATYSGFVNGDNASSLTTQPTVATTATSASPIGTYPTTASGAVDPNYTITYVPGVLTVGQAVLTVTATNESMTYGGTVPALPVTYSGFVNGEGPGSLTAQPTATTTATGASPAGTYPITPGGAVDPNYTFVYVPGTLTVSQAVLTVTATSENMTYGGTVPALPVTYSGFVNGDNASSLTTQPTATTTATSASPAGTYPITPSGAVDPNYTFTYVPGTLTIGPAALTITATDESMTYGGTVPALPVTYSGFVNGDGPGSLTTAPNVTTSATSASPVGTYPITPSGAVDPNYTITYTPGTLTIGQAALTITAGSTSMTYGSTVPVLTATYSGFVNGDNASSLTTAPTVTTTATSASPIGTYPTTASGAVDPNYSITYVPGVLTVGQAVLTVTATSENMTYGGTLPALPVSYSGFVNGDGPGSLTTPATATTTATGTSPAGTYPITPGGAVDPNYTFVYVPGTLTIGKATLTVTATSESMIYGGTLPALPVTYSGFVNGDNASSLTTQATATTTATSASPAGMYPITPGGAVDPNYTISYVPGTLTIGQAALTITATDESMTYGGTVPALTVTYSGFVNGDGPSSLTTAPVISTTATSASPVGTYPITPGGAVDPNYTISYVAGTLTIGKATLTITADNKSRYFLLPNPPLTVTYAGFVNGDGPGSLTTKPTVTTTATLLSLPGVYPITASGAVAANYDFTYVAGTLTV